MELDQIVISVFLLCIRIFCAFIVFQSFRSQIGNIVTMTLATGLAVYGVLVLKVSVGEDYQFNSFNILTLAFSEGVIGLISAIPYMIAVEVIPISARIIELSRGAQFAEQQNPALGGRTCLLEQLAIMLSGWLLLNFLFDGFLSSLLIPNGWSDNSLSNIFGSNDKRWKKFLLLYGKVLSSAFLHVLPFVGICFSIDIFIGIASRFSERLNLLYEVLCLKLIIGLACFFLYINFYLVKRVVPFLTIVV